MGSSPQLRVIPTGAADAAHGTFDAIFEREFSYVWRTLGRLGISDADREDLANEVFFQFFRRLPALDLDRPLRPLLFAFAFRIASSHRRLARHRLEKSVELPDAVDTTVGADESMERREAEDLVHRALAAIDIDQRAVFVMHEIDGFAMPEIAKALAIPLNTAYSRLRLARARFAATVRRIKLQRGEA
jgi:RNA polymerase sigma-70 factor, ECF subfamily